MDSGLYSISIHMSRPVYVQVGALGSFSVSPGWYVYTGSASKNLQKRVERHLSPKNKLRWHIDYLTATAAAKPIGAVLVPDGLLTQCELNQKVGNLMGNRAPIPGFGASDCRSGCPAHLWFSPKRVALEILCRVHAKAVVFRL